MTTDLRTKLMPHERMLWSGIPAQGWMFTSSDIFLIPFSVLWLGFVTFWEFGVHDNGAPWFFMLWGAMFLVVGLFFFIGRFVLDAWLRRQTSYAVTDQRILIVRAAPWARFTAIEFDRLPEMTLVGEGRPRSSIRFGAAAALNNRSLTIWTPSLDPVPQFLGIPDSAHVFAMISDASRKARAAR
jgi:hypothetical protein